MDDTRRRSILEGLRRGQFDVDEALSALERAEAEQFRDVRLDPTRRERTGVPELVWAQGKTDEQLLEAVHGLIQSGRGLLVTRVQPEQAQLLAREVTAGEWHPQSRIFRLPDPAVEPTTGSVAVACAGTTDVPVAEEAALTAEFLGVRAERIFDVGVAGLHRLLAARERLARFAVVVVAAGMEGALPSVVAGLVPGLVIAVPTSVGYGLHLGGVTPLLAMLNSCAPGVLVTNIDNGVGAGVAAARIQRLREEAP